MYCVRVSLYCKLGLPGLQIGVLARWRPLMYTTPVKIQDIRNRICESCAIRHYLVSKITVKVNGYIHYSRQPKFNVNY